MPQNTTTPPHHPLIPNPTGPVPGVARFPRELIFTLAYLTDKAALAGLLPEGFEPADPPMVQFRYRFSDRLDWALNSSHDAVGVSVPCRITHAGRAYEGVHWLALWENDFTAVILGREVFGVAKLGADIHHQSHTDGEHRAMLSEAGRPLIELRFRTGQQLHGTELDELRRRGAANHVLGYKQIPNARNDGIIMAHPTIYRHTVTIDRAWDGDGEVIVHQPDPAVHVGSAPLITSIRALPLLQPLAAVLTTGSAELDMATGRELTDHEPSDPAWGSRYPQRGR
ncbi:acetoacetate decarboxylase family protein [Nocardia terpenica]|uniref:acetoacetate decarboxylase family protein n=1 Tax=Nocardia terpenica TaxID=455432 RepID=UPI0018944964|nr:acetoacetate decarboxylase family protein [Nocardia terpenica]MBF6065189.1 acetoacetate decarboxylase family protein [Nocardia terpenica]MBF6107916.1 acetoacetate decarboxylase family protein [Nocardia terpenica]MBF6115553.1 acetoacetate decarboxylase family protein [Nocardia terpenica]MBF6121990.1 acetoacetate decarboxylase family protein [Nocardia terpenica]MBF6155466.1 acetoacetate decarboxylase family protein [Nocardia terpenica]